MDNFIGTSSQVNQIYLWNLIGTAVFGVSGTLAGPECRMDMFDMLILAFVTGVGGGILRDAMIGSIPVFWMNNLTYILMIAIGVVPTAIFRKQSFEHWNKPLMLFDTIGLGVFAVIGMGEALRFGLSPTMTIILGTMTDSFGGVIRDILANKLPAFFHKGIYATACIAGGTVYFLINRLMNHNLVVFITIIIATSVRSLSLKYHWELPRS